MTIRSLALAALCLLPVACRSVHYRDSTGNSLLLAESEQADGTKTTWRLYPGPGRDNAPRIDVTRSSEVERPYVGVTVTPMTRRRAEQAGVEPWKGVWVDAVRRGGPFSEAGIVPGDVVLAVDGAAVTSPEQFVDLVRSRGVPGEPLQVELRVYRRQGEPVEGGSATVGVVPDSVRDRESATESLELDYSPALQTYTGLQVGSVPAEVAREVYGTEEPVVVVTGVVTGSPAYRAGFRRGDRVNTCDGAPVADVDDVRAALHRRLRDRSWPLEDLARYAGGEGEATSDPIALSVTGPLGRHEASMRVTRGMRDVTDVDIPILFEYRRTADSKRVSFLDFIFQFGFNYWRQTLPSETRETVRAWELSILPLGMFEFESKQSHMEYTLFWVIDFATYR